MLHDFGTTFLGAFRGDDYAGRYGGEKFVFILADTDQTEADKSSRSYTAAGKRPAPT